VPGHGIAMVSGFLDTDAGNMYVVHMCEFRFERDEVKNRANQRKQGVPCAEVHNGAS